MKITKDEGRRRGGEGGYIKPGDSGPISGPGVYIEGHTP